MDDIFLSYHSSDRATAHTVASALEAYGWSVWWDREIPIGKNFDQVIEERLLAARCVVVLWSKAAVLSRWVRTEASTAANRDCLVPVLIENVAIPLEFRQIQTAEMPGWDGDTGNTEFLRLIAAIEARLHSETSPAKPSPSVSPRSPPKRSKKLLIRGAAAAVLLLAIAGIMLGVLLSDHSGDTDMANTVLPIPTPSSDHSDATSKQASRETRTNDSPVAPASLKQIAAEATSAGAIAIRIGERIEENVPAPGSGSIETPFQEDRYTFSAQPGQRVYFRVLNYTNDISGLYWKLTDESGQQIFNTCLGCSDPGVQRLTTGGQYTLTVGSTTDPATGTYRLRLYDVPPPGQFAVRIGTTIEQDQPAVGAGVIESAGAEDIYTFTATPGQRVYFRLLEHSKEADYVKWKLKDDDDTTLFDTCFGCSEPGVEILRKGGNYQLTVGQQTVAATGTYRIRLIDVPTPDQFSIALPVRISVGVPGAGAGMIESSGAEDRYTFTAQPGQTVYFKLLNYDNTLTYNALSLLDEDGVQLFRVCFGCTVPGVQKLTHGGAYTLVVGSSTDPSTGGYTLEIGNSRH